MGEMTGKCLCGAVRFSAQGAEPKHEVCHCGMCRKWAGSGMMTIACKEVRFEGEEHVRRFDSSDWAQRGFCGTCGTSLFYLFKPKQQYFISRGVFDDQEAFKLVGEIYVDAQPKDYAFAGDLERLTEAEFIAKFQGAG